MAAIKHIFNELHYEMTRKIADGGMGVVYEAQQLGSGNFRKVVAVKLIREEYSAIEEFRNLVDRCPLVVKRHGTVGDRSAVARLRGHGSRET